MAYGFYITQRGLEKIAQAANTGGKVVINQYLVGNGGDLEGERDLGITKLNHELYRKSLTDLDSFELSGTKVLIKTVLPDEVPAMTFNEAGYLDTDDELIVYGTFGDITKNPSNPEAPQTVEHRNYIEFTANQIDYITIQTENESLDTLIGQVNDLEKRVKALETTLNGVAEFLEGIS